MIRKFTIYFFIAFTIIIFSSSQVNAQDIGSPSSSIVTTVIDVRYELVNPTGGISYLFKRIGEKISLFIAFSNNSKVNNYRKLVDVRLSELKYIIEKKEMAFFEKSTQRYFTTAGQYTSFLISKNIKSEFVPAKEVLLSHIPVLIKLRDTYDPSTAEWRFVEDDVNYIKGYIDDLSTRQP